MDFHRLRVVNFDTNLRDKRPRHRTVYSKKAVADNVTHVFEEQRKEIHHGGGDRVLSNAYLDNTTSSKDSISFKRGSNSKTGKKRIRFQPSSLFTLNKTSYIPRRKFKKQSSIIKASTKLKYTNRNEYRKGNNNDNIQMMFTHDRSKLSRTVERRRSPFGRDRNRHWICGNSKSSHNICGFKSGLVNPYLYYQYSCSDCSSNIYQTLKQMRKRKEVKKCCSHYPLKVVRSLSLKDLKSELCFKSPVKTWCPYNLVNFAAREALSPYVSSSKLNIKEGGKRKDIGYHAPRCTKAGKDQATATSSRVSINEKGCCNAAVGTSKIAFQEIKNYGYKNLLRKYSKPNVSKAERKVSTFNKIAHDFREGSQKLRGIVKTFFSKNVQSNHRSRANNLFRCLLLSIFVIVWSPCVFVAIIVWAIAAPLRPSNVITARRKERSSCKPVCSRGSRTPLVPTLTKITHKFVDAYQALLSLFTGNKRHQKKLTRSHKTKSKHPPNPDPEKKYTLFYKNSRGWMAKPLRDELKRKHVECIKCNKSCTKVSSSTKNRSYATATIATQCTCCPNKAGMVKQYNKRTSTLNEVSHSNDTEIPDHIAGPAEKIIKKTVDCPICRNYKQASSTQLQTHINSGDRGTRRTDIQQLFIHSDCSCFSPSSKKLDRPRVKIVENSLTHEITKGLEQEGKCDRYQQCKICDPVPKTHTACDAVDLGIKKSSCKFQPICKKTDIKKSRKPNNIIAKMRLAFCKLQCLTKKTKLAQSAYKPRNKTCRHPTGPVPDTKTCSQLLHNKNNIGVVTSTSRPIDVPSRCHNVATEEKQLLSKCCQCEARDIRANSEFSKSNRETDSYLSKSHAPKHQKPKSKLVQSTSRMQDAACRCSHIPRPTLKNSQSASAKHLHRCHVACRPKHQHSGIDHTLVKLEELATQYDIPVNKFYKKQTLSSPQLKEHKRYFNHSDTTRHPTEKARSKSVGHRQNITKKYTNTGKAGFFDTLSSRCGKHSKLVKRTSESDHLLCRPILPRSCLDHTLSKLSKFARKYELPASKMGTRPPKTVSRPGSRQNQFCKGTQSIRKRKKPDSKLKKSSSSDSLQRVEKLETCCPCPVELPKTQISPKPLRPTCETTKMDPIRKMEKTIEKEDTKQRVVTKRPVVTKNKIPHHPCLSLDRLSALLEQARKRNSIDRTHPSVMRNYQCRRSHLDKKFDPKLRKNYTVTINPDCKVLDESVDIHKKTHRKNSKGRKGSQPRKVSQGRKSSKGSKGMTNAKVKKGQKGIKVSTNMRNRRHHGSHGGGVCSRFINSIRSFFIKLYNFDKAAWPDVPCKDIYLYTLREKPHFWIYNKFPKLYPCFLSWYRFYQNSCRLIIYSAASCLWFPVFCCLYFCCNTICKCCI